MQNKKLQTKVYATDDGNVVVDFFGDGDMLYVLSNVLSALGYEDRITRSYQDSQMKSILILNPKNIKEILEQFSKDWNEYMKERERQQKEAERKRKEVLQVLNNYHRLIQVVDK